MSNQAIVKWFTRCVVLTVLACLGCDSDETSYSLVPAADPAPPATDDESLRRLQMVRIYDHDAGGNPPQPAWRDVAPDDLIANTGTRNYLYKFCTIRSGAGQASPAAPCSGNVETPDTCKAEWCQTRVNLCMTHLLLEAAGTRVVPLVLDYVAAPNPIKVKFEIAVQSSATAAALLRLATKTANQATYVAANALLGAAGVTPRGPTTCTAGGLTHRQTPENLAGFLASSVAESYYLRREATFKAVDAIASYADYRSAHPALRAKIEAGVLASQLSRSEAAHLLVGGDAGLVQSPFCTAPELSGPVLSAVRTLREAAVPPSDVISSVATETILNTGTANGASVKARLARQWNQPSMTAAGAGSIQSQLRLGTEDFEAARNYLAQEIRAFSRTRFAKLADDTVGTGINDFSRWAGTAAEPSALPSVYYAAIAGFRTTTSNPEFIDQAGSYVEYVDAVATTITKLLQTTTPPVAALWSEITPTLATLQADAGRDRVARWTYCFGSPGTTTVHGMRSTDGLYVVVGEDALRCALKSSVEGDTSCTLQTSGFPASWVDGAMWAVPLTGSPTPAAGFSVAASASRTLPSVNLYLMQSSTGQPGTFRALAGRLIAQNGQCQSVSVVDGVYDRVAELISPSTKWCSHPTVSCSKGTFDERLPLENELASDGDDVESSWKHYLALARQAADEADALGTAYIEAGLSTDQRAEAEEIREHANDVQAMESLEELQDICGTNIDPTVLLNTFKDLKVVQTGTGTTCTSDQNCTGDRRCYGGRCIVDPIAAAATVLPKEEYDRLAQCFVDNEVLPFLAIGDKPLCLWRKTGSPNDICGGYSPTFTPADHPCPDVAPGTTCAGFQAPAGHEVAPLVTDLLEYFNTSMEPPGNAPDQDTCNDIRRLRLSIDAGNLPAQPALVDAMRQGEFFHPSNVASLARRVGWDARYQSYSAITMDGNPSWYTGDAWTGPAGGAWPCNAASRPTVCVNGTGSGLFCDVATCSDINDRSRLNNRMYRAVVALRATGLGRLGKTVPNILGGVNFPIWTGPSRDSIVVRQRFGTSVPVTVVKDNASTIDTAFEVTSSVPADKVAWVTPDFNFQRYKDMGSYDEALSVFDIAGYRSLSTNETMGVFTNQLFTERRTPLPPPQMPGDPAWWDGLSSAPPNPSKPYSGYFDQVLRGQRQALEVGVDRFDVNSSVSARNSGTGRMLFRPFDWEPRDLLDGLELACEVGLGSRTKCDSRKPPPINSVEDLAVARQYLECVAGEIEYRAGRGVLAKVPRRAKDALKKESSIGAFPAAGGEWGVAISGLRAALVGLSEVQPTMAGELRGLGDDMEALRISLARAGIQEQMADVQFMAQVSQQIAACAGSGLTAFATCANSLAQIEFAGQLNKLAEQDSAFARELQVNDFAGMFATRAQNMERLSKQLLEELERIDASLATIEGLRSSARRALSKALYMSTFQAATSINVEEILRKRLNTNRIRYERAHENAKRLGFLAKRAIEQRLGVRLSEMKEELPLVAAPSSWESTVCTAQGLDYSKLRQRIGADVATPIGTVFTGATDYADAFIGDYVTKLENLVESYRLTFDFHEGSDTAVVSLRDDVHNVRAECEAPLPNLLYQSGTFDANTDGVSAPGWQRLRCATTGNPPTLVPNCIDATPTNVPVFPSVNPEVASALTYNLRFGDGGTCPAASCGWTTDAALAQRVTLKAGRYALSWHADVAPTVNGSPGGVLVSGLVSLRDATGAIVPAYANGSEPLIASSGLTRRWLAFDLKTDQDVFVEIRAPGALRVAKVGAFMLESARDAVGTRASRGPRDYVGTSDKVTQVLPMCEDRTGTVFRATRWDRRCLYLCPNGFGDDCSASSASTQCYRETTFGINQRDIESGNILSSSGFARGNFNYRIDKVSVNFVGSEARDCEDSQLPSTCFSAGFVPYSLYHHGPFFVRNHMGRDFKASLFNGRIEHARGLALERYITNPISATDTDLLGQFTRQEFQGRPLDGTFVLRVWEEPGVNFDAIQDVQVVLNYRYWTRFD